MRFAVDIEAIEQRAARIGLTIGHLADDAGMARSTAYRVVRHGQDPRASTVAKLVAALDKRELAMLAHLVALHPAPAEELLMQRTAA